MSSSALPFLSSRWNRDSDCAIYGYNIYDDGRVDVKGRERQSINAQSKLPEEKGPEIHRIIRQLGYGLARAMAGARINAQQNRPVVRAAVVLCHGLHQGRHFPGVHRVHARIRLGSHEERCRVGYAFAYVVIGRVTVQVAELLTVFSRAVLRDPEPGNLKLVVTKHIQQRHLAHSRAKQVWTLRDHSAHQQPAVASALNRQMLGIGIAGVDQVFSRGNKIIKHVLLLLQHAVAVPFFAELIAAAQLRVNIDAAALQQQKHGIAVEYRGAAYVESAITGKECGSVPRAQQAFAAYHEHGDASTVF